MDTEKDKKEAVIFYVLHNQHHFKTICNDILKQRRNLLYDEPKEYHDDINKECLTILKNVIITEICKDMALDALTVSSVLSDFDVLQYLS